MSTPQHRKPGSATKARTMAVRAAAIGAVAVPGAALAAHELATQQPDTAPLQPVDDAQPLSDLAGAHPGGQDAFSPSDVQSTIHWISAQREKTVVEADEAANAAHAKAEAAASAAAKAKKTTTVSYTVQEGDSLSGIAERTLGSASAYTDIFALNKDRAEPGGARFTDPSLIQPGWTLTLPSGAKTHGSATATSWTSSKSSDSSSSSSSSSTKTRSSSDNDGNGNNDGDNSNNNGNNGNGNGNSGSTRSSDSPSSETRATGGLNSWIDEAISVLAEHGTDVSYNAVYQTVIHESGGNPDAVNGTDSNALEGHPSIGLMQTIQSTFNAYALPGYDDIYNPVDNIIAASRYAAAVYGSLNEMVEARCDGGCWRGY